MKSKDDDVIKFNTNKKNLNKKENKKTGEPETTIWNGCIF